ncbi:PfaD family polyunsaturated fatty acid/polyketide biosynthesis protein [Amycolatopsis sp. NPDC051102]|uniref:PfaD family polyunsaturated fatty acid/polyketide biosynthesis protein n=1 Tax=Amycolatopsis sp. NPDC051102 TaxID=3155163 RepID=UPI0034165B0A
MVTMISLSQNGAGRVSHDIAASFDPVEVTALVGEIRQPLGVLQDPATGRRGVRVVDGSRPGGSGLLGVLPASYPEWLGSREFCAAHHTRFPYLAGEMSTGIATTEMVEKLARAGLMGFFGAGGLREGVVRAAVERLGRSLCGRHNWGVNLLHSPNEPAVEARTARLLVELGVPAVSASAYMDLTPSLVLCMARGLRADRSGGVARPRRVLAKVSRPETAERFLSPPPAPMLRRLVEDGELSEEEAVLAARIPVAEDITVEADSGGHTDNRPLAIMLPAIRALRDRLAGPAGAVRIGAAGGLGTPAAVATAFALGADYVLTGSVNQAAVESGMSADGRRMLAGADLTDTAMAPAADMFEMGVRLQVLRRGTLFAGRAGLLYELYQAHGSLEEIPARRRAQLEEQVFRRPLETVWAETARFWADRDPAQVTRAETDAKHRMALVFRWYLGRSSRWAITGDPARRADYQIWCGPAMGAFNRWAAGSFLDPLEHRTVVQIALNLLEGAAVITRAHQARTCGLPVTPAGFGFTPRRLAEPGGAR